MAVGAPVDRDAVVVDLLRAILAELQALRADQRQRSASLSRADQAHLARLLPAITGTFGSERVAVWELFEAPAVRLVLDALALNARQVGRLLRRAIGQPIAGLVVERDEKKELNRTLWRVTAPVDEFRT